jgi:tetratricopeptide (TPR) repeat protein
VASPPFRKIIVPVQISHPTVVKLTGFAGVAAVAGACHYFGLGELTGLLGTGLALAGATAHAWVGHLGVELVKDISERTGEESARGVQNRDLHRLMGQVIARILEREATSAPGDKSGAVYLKEAAEAFRGDSWMEVELTGPEIAVSESNVTTYFTGDAEKICHTPVLEHAEWMALVEKVVGSPTQIRENIEALNYAAAKLRAGFAAEVWEAAKDAWKKDDLAWPALNLRLLGQILSQVRGPARQVAGFREEVAALRDAIRKAADAAESAAPSAYNVMLKAAISEYQNDVNAKLDLNFQRVLDELAELKTALANPRTAPVKEPLINLPNTTKEILARDHEARELLDALRCPGPGIVSITAPPGFGKSAVFALALRLALLNGNAREAGLDGIAVLDAKTAAPGIASFASLLGRITGLQEIAARFTSAAECPGGSLRDLFFDFVRQAGKVWLVVENAEEVLVTAEAAAADFGELLNAWCQAGHEGKLLLLTRRPVYPTLECHRRMSDVEKALLGGLPEEAAVKLLRQRLVHTRFYSTAESLLRQIVQRLHRVPMALEQFAGYLHWHEQGIEIDQHFLDRSDLLRLRASEQMEDLLLRVIGQTLELLDAPSISMLRVAAWAGISVPFSGLTALHEDGGAALTQLVRSNLLLAAEGTAAEGRSFDVHALIREALADSFGSALDFAHISWTFGKAGGSEWEKGQFRPALSLYVLAERAARVEGERDELAKAIRNRGNALANLGRLEEALSASNESIAIYRVLVQDEHRLELRDVMATTIMNRGNALARLGRLEEALSAYDESIAIHRVLVLGEHRLELRNDMAIAIMNRGNALTDLGRLNEALLDYDESIAVYRVLVQDENRLELRNDMAKALTNRGLALKNLSRLKEALSASDESIAIYRVLVQDEHRLELRNDMAGAIINWGVALTDLGRLEEAVSAYKESIAIYRVLVKDEHRLESRNYLALALFNLAAAYEQQRTMRVASVITSKAALDAVHEACQLWEDLIIEEGMTHLEQNLAWAKRLEARIGGQSLQSKSRA